jgi:hypothetical protein
MGLSAFRLFRVDSGVLGSIPYKIPDRRPVSIPSERPGHRQDPVFCSTSNKPGITITGARGKELEQDALSTLLT